MKPSMSRFLDLGFRKRNLQPQAPQLRGSELGVSARRSAGLMYAAAGLIVVIAAGIVSSELVWHPQRSSTALLDRATAIQMEVLQRAQSLAVTRGDLEIQWRSLDSADYSTGYSVERARLSERIRAVDDSLVDIRKAIQALGIRLDTIRGGAAAGRTGELARDTAPRVWFPRPPWVSVALSAIGIIVGLGLLALLAAFLRSMNNPVPWQLGCWILLSLGILSRQAFLGPLGPPPEPHPSAVADDSGKKAGPSAKGLVPDGGRGRIDVVAARQQGPPYPMNMGSLLFSAVLGLAVFPYAMRRLNRLRPEPGLEHVAVPFSLGFFLDLAHVAAVTWLPRLFGR